MILQLISIFRMKRYKLFTRPYELNIIGVRSASTVSNRFDDELHVLFKDAKNKWKHYQFPITTDPGTYWLEHPLNVDGTAILKEGQYENAYKLGLHKGQYKALIQVKPVTVIRDYDRNATLDFFNGNESTGYFGINIHRGNPNGITNSVDKWSAGCQVFENIKDFTNFLTLCARHQLYYGNQFSYTLIDMRAIKRMKRRFILYGVGTGLTIGGGLLFYFLKT